MHIEESQLKTFILDSGLVSRADIESALRESEDKGISLGKILVNKGKIKEDDLRRMTAHILGISFVDLRNERLPFDVLSLIPEPISRNHNIVAFKKGNNVLEVAMLDMDDLSAIDFLKNKIGLRIIPRLTNEDSIKNVILQYQKGLRSKFGALIPEDVNTFRNTDENIIISRIVDTLLQHAILQGASDVHIEPQEGELLVRYRLNGVLHDAMVLPKTMSESLAFTLKSLGKLDIEESEIPQDGRFAVESNGEKISLRVSSLPTYYGEKIVVRLLRENVSGFTLERLGFHGEGLELLHKAIKSNSGLILSVGPTGSGKTTTLYTILDILNTPNVNISTIEDPIEYKINRINQTQIRPDIGFTFVSGVRTLLRQDPDIIMVGEIRDGETAVSTINAASGTHLVLGTLVSSSATSALRNLLDMKVPPILITSSLKIIISGRLIRKLANKTEKYFLTKAELGTLGKSVDLNKVLAALKAEKVVSSVDTWDKIPFWRLKKDTSSHSEYIGIYEVLKISSPIKEIILKSGSLEALQKQAEADGMLTMLEDGIFKAVQGLTTIEDVLGSTS